jgi:hypothetical protein
MSPEGSKTKLEDAYHAAGYLLRITGNFIIAQYG